MRVYTPVNISLRCATFTKKPKTNEKKPYRTSNNSNSLQLQGRNKNRYKLRHCKISREFREYKFIRISNAEN